MTVLFRGYFVSRKQISRLERNDKYGHDDDMERTETQNKDSIVRILVNVERKQRLLCEWHCSLGFGTLNAYVAILPVAYMIFSCSS